MTFVHIMKRKGVRKVKLSPCALVFTTWKQSASASTCSDTIIVFYVGFINMDKQISTSLCAPSQPYPYIITTKNFA